MQKIVLFDIDDVLFDTNYFIQSSLTKFRLYPDVKDVLINLSKTSTLGILSQGEIEFQKSKLIETNIYNLFPKKHIHIVPRKDTKLNKELEIYKKYNGKIFFVDNLILNLYHVKNSLNSINALFLNRGRYVNADQEISGFCPDITIENLNDIIPIVESDK